MPVSWDLDNIIASSQSNVLHIAPFSLHSKYLVTVTLSSPQHFPTNSSKNEICHSTCVKMIGMENKLLSLHSLPLLLISIFYLYSEPVWDLRTVSCWNLFAFIENRFILYHIIWLWFPLHQLLQDPPQTPLPSRSTPFLCLTRHLKNNNRIRWNKSNKQKKRSQRTSTRNTYRRRDTFFRAHGTFIKTQNQKQRICKIKINKQINKSPTKALWDRKTSKDGTGFVVCWQSTGQGYGLRGICIPSETLLKKTNFSMCEQSSIEGSFWVRDGASQGSHVAQTCADPAHAARVSVSIYVYGWQYCCVWRTMFLQCPSSTLALIIIPPPPPQGSLTLRGGIL